MPESVTINKKLPDFRQVRLHLPLLPACLLIILAYSLSVADSDGASAPQSNAGRTKRPTSGQRGLEHPEVKPKAGSNLTGKTYALLVGVSRYKYDPPITSLLFANKDAETFAAFLKKPIAGSLDEKDEIRLLTDKKATRAAVDNAVQEFAKKPGGPNNTLILFVAAHGVYLTEEMDPKTHGKIQKNPYILLYDAHDQDAKTTGYPMDEFRRMIAQQALRFGRVLVFLDICHAANVAGIAGASEGQEAVKRAWQGQGGEFGLMLASQARGTAIESTSFGGGHGAFSYFLLNGLNGPAAFPGDSSITFADLADYVHTNVYRFTRKAQDPLNVARNTDMVIIPDTHKEGLPLPPARPLSDQDLKDLRRRRGASGPVRTAQPAPEQRPHDPFENALERGLLLPEEPGSASVLLSALRRDPNQFPADIKERERQLRIALEDQGQDIMSHYLEGEEVPQTKLEFDRCARLFEEALKLAPGDIFDRSRGLFCQGRAQIFLGRYDDAQRLLDDSIGLDPLHAYAYNALGIAHLERIARTGRGFTEAADAFRSAMRYAPYWAYPVHNLALVLSESGDYEGAIRLYQYGMSIAPNYSYLPYNLGLLYERLGDFDNAQHWFEKAEEVLEKSGRPHGASWPNRAPIWNALGTVARSNGRDGRALDFFQKALADDPEDRNSRHNLALLLAKRREFDQSDDLWRANIAADPPFMPSRVAYAESLASRGETRAAIHQYEWIVSDKPEYVGAREALARLYMKANQPECAIFHLNGALSQSGSNPSLLELRGDAYARLGQVKLARDDWTKAAAPALDRNSTARLRRKLRGAR